MNLATTVIITDEMTQEEKAAAVARHLADAYATVTKTPEWSLMAGGLERKVEKLAAELASTAGDLTQRQEDRLRGQIAAYRDVLAIDKKAEMLAGQLEAQAATTKERADARERAERGDYGGELGGLPGFGHHFAAGDAGSA